MLKKTVRQIGWHYDSMREDDGTLVTFRDAPIFVITWWLFGRRIYSRVW